MDDSDEATDKIHSEIYATLLPDEILKNTIPSYPVNCALIVGDISGFTELTEKYNQAGQGGPSRLTETLNSYIGTMVVQILNHKGDLLKFSGDAFLAWFKCSPGDNMEVVTSRALSTAVRIQQDHGYYSTDVNVNLRVKLCVACGEAIWGIIGDEECRNWVAIGPPIIDVKRAAVMVGPGEIVVCPSAWLHANHAEYEFEEMDDPKYIRLLGVIENWTNLRFDVAEQTQSSEQYREQNPNLRIDQLLRLYGLDTENTDSLRGLDLRSLISVPDSVPFIGSTFIPGQMDNTVSTKYKFRQYDLRPSVLEAIKTPKMRQKLLPFMLRPVIRAVERDEPLEYLTEMRYVVIMMINILLQQDTSNWIKIISDCYTQTQKVVRKKDGCVNKAVFFDKDLMFLTIFGLRGYKHALESLDGLQCAAELHEALLEKGVSLVSIGVTTGMTYCGVVGHILRREYTVIGTPVNRAARIMMAYPGIVTCDKETLLGSRLPATNFEVQQPKKLKGIEAVGPIYKFTPKSEAELSIVVQPHYPLLGRFKEMSTFKTLVSKFLKKRENSEKLQLIKLIVIEGAPREGKTRLLDEILYFAQQNYSVNCTKLSLNYGQLRVPFAMLALILDTEMDLKSKSQIDREFGLKKTFEDLPNKEDLLFLLNPLFHVEFPNIGTYVQTLTQTKGNTNREKIIGNLVSKAFQKCWVIGVDDCEYADFESWRFLPTLLERTSNVFLVMTLGKRHPIPKHASSLIKHYPGIERIRLSPIHSRFHIGICCQILDVAAIPTELLLVIQSRSNGNPGWIESFLVNLMQASNLIMTTVLRSEFGSYDLKRASKSMLVRVPYSWADSLQNSIDENFSIFVPSSIKYSEYATVCLFAKNFKIDEFEIDQSMDVMMTRMLDSLPSKELLILKSASVVGEIIHRKMLSFILSTPPAHELASSIKKLFDIHFFTCATVEQFTNRINDSLEIFCQCNLLPDFAEEVISEGLEEFPAYAACRLFRFRLPMLRETAYQSLTDNLRKEYHSKSVSFLRQDTNRCRSCGGGAFFSILGYRNQDIFEQSQMDQSHMLVDHTQDHYLKKVILDPTFDDIYFINCQCLMILQTMYTQMLIHTAGSRHDDQFMQALLEYSSLCIYAGNLPKAIDMLQIAENMLRMKNDVFPEWKIPLLKSKICRLNASTQFALGENQVALKFVTEAMSYLGHNPPKRFVGFLTLISMIELKFRLTREISFHGEKKTLDDQLVQTWIVYCNILRKTNNLSLAKFIAIRTVIKALKANSDYLIICLAFKNLISIMLLNLKPKFTRIIERAVLLIVNEMNDMPRKLEIQEAEAISNLYWGIFAIRARRAEIEKALSIGIMHLNLTKQVNMTRGRSEVASHIYCLQLEMGRIGEAVTFLENFDVIGMDVLTQPQMFIWYTALCLHFQLDTGYTIIPFNKCEEFYLRECSVDINDPELINVKLFFLVNMLVWCMRMQEWEKAIIFTSKAQLENTWEIMPNCSMIKEITMMRLIEYLIFKYCLNKETYIGKRTEKLLDKLFKFCKRVVCYNKHHIPRYWILRAFFMQAKGHRYTAFKLIKKGSTKARLQNNQLIYSWCEHNILAWNGTLNESEIRMWQKHVKGDYLHWHEFYKTKKYVQYAFPYPRTSLV